MNLLVDIGNSRIKWSLHDSAKNVFCSIDAFFYLDQELQILFDQHWENLKKPNRVLVANVSNPHIAENLTVWVARAWQLETEYVETETSNHGIHNAYPDYKTLGVDRWLAMIAAWHKFKSYKKAICVIDCGTATTMDGIAETGEHIGGVIFPGYALMQKMLMENTYQINITKKTIPSFNFSDTTQQGINSGCSLATIATIDRLVDLMGDRYGETITCLITGGNAKSFIPNLAHKFEYEPNLVLCGLAIYSDTPK